MVALHQDWGRSRHDGRRSPRLPLPRKGGRSYVRENIIRNLSAHSSGLESHPVKVSRQPEASLASSSEMAARSVDSEHRSRVIEPRKNLLTSVPSSSSQRGQHDNRRYGQPLSTVRGPRAGQMCIGNAWEHGRASWPPSSRTRVMGAG